MSNNGKTLNVQEVAVLIKSSVPTISSWYRWKALHPDHELAKLLPEFKRQGPHNARVWEYSDVWKLIAFRDSLPQGRNGIMGDVTQKYVKKPKKEK